MPQNLLILPAAMYMPVHLLLPLRQTIKMDYKKITVYYACITQKQQPGHFDTIDFHIELAIYSNANIS